MELSTYTKYFVYFMFIHIFTQKSFVKEVNEKTGDTGNLHNNISEQCFSSNIT